MSEWSEIKCKACGWEGDERITVSGKAGCPSCGSTEDLVYKSDDEPIEKPDHW